MLRSPVHRHDCNWCRHLGSVQFAGKVADLYVCAVGDKSEMDTLVARYSSDGPDYSSTFRSLAKNYPADHPIRLAKAIDECSCGDLR